MSGGGAVARVFVSHASDGLDQAAEVHQWLTEAGHEVFLDRHRRDGIGVGEEWRQRLHERLRWAERGRLHCHLGLRLVQVVHG